MNNDNSPETTQLLRELLQLQENFPPDAGGGPLLAVVRFIPGLDLAGWEHMLDTSPLRGWCAMEMATGSPCQCRAQKLADPLPDLFTPPGDCLYLDPFLEQINKELLRARRGHAEVSLIVFSLQGDQDSTTLRRLVSAQAEACDSLSDLGAARCALLLPGANVYKAQVIAGRICNMLEHADRRCTAGIVCSNGCNTHAGQLARNALNALEEARRTGFSLHVYQEPQQPEPGSETLVQSDEKRFLFSGGEEYE